MDWKSAMAEALKRQRAGARSWVTRAKTTLEETLGDPEVGKLDIVDAMEELNIRIASFDDYQAQYEVSCPEEEFDTVLEDGQQFREEARKVRERAAKLLEQLQNDDEADSVSSHSHSTMKTASSGLSRPDVRLPKLELPKFQGDVLEWESFWDQFRASVHESELPEVTKFTYLKSLLVGEAVESIKGLSLTSSHYATAIDLLKKRYGRRERIILKHVQELLAMGSVPHQGSTSGLRKLYDNLLGHIRSLEALQISGEQYGVLLTPIVLTCLPERLRTEWARGSEGKESDLEFLLKFLQTEIDLMETSQTF